MMDGFEIIASGMCKDCPCADLEIHKFMANNVAYRWVIQCTHHNACVRTKNEAQKERV